MSLNIAKHPGAVTGDFLLLETADLCGLITLRIFSHSNGEHALREEDSIPFLFIFPFLHYYKGLNPHPILLLFSYSVMSDSL